MKLSLWSIYNIFYFFNYSIEISIKISVILRILEHEILFNNVL